MKAEYIDHMGDDSSVVRAARVSFANDGCLTIREKDDKLIAYLAKHNHWTPFAHTAITFRVSAPVPIRTQCFKHKQGFVENEESRRYISGTPELYVPEVWRKAPTGGAKQGSGGVFDDKMKFYFEDGAHAFIPVDQVYTSAVEHAVNIYKQMVAAGVCPEQARFVLPQGVLVNWYWTGSLAAYARFYNQRTDPHAQKEIQQLAEIIGEKLGELFPVSWKALTDG